MATVIDDNTGEEVEVKPVQAVVAISMTSTMSDLELPPDASKRIEEAMSAAVTIAMGEGITDPDEIRAAMLQARERCKLAMRSEMEMLKSRLAAERLAAEQAAAAGEQEN